MICLLYLKKKIEGCFLFPSVHPSALREINWTSSGVLRHFPGGKNIFRENTFKITHLGWPFFSKFVSLPKTRPVGRDRKFRKIQIFKKISRSFMKLHLQSFTKFRKISHFLRYFCTFLKLKKKNHYFGKILIYLLFIMRIYLYS